MHVGKTCAWVRAARAHHAAFRGFSFFRSVTSDAEIRVMAAEEGLLEDSFEVPALLLLIGRAPGLEGRPPGEAKSSKGSCFKIWAFNLLLSISSSQLLLNWYPTRILE